jgi:ribosomal protein S12 methylthiotransferase accessory factor
MSRGADASAVDLVGTIRATTVEATLARTRELLRAFGITRIGNVTGLDHVGVPTWQVVRPLARSLTVSQGKGLTDGLAQASGIMESIELHHAEHFVPRGHRKSLRDAARDQRYVNPLLLPVLPGARIDDDASVEWIEGLDLASAASRWVPRDCIDLDSVSRRKPRLFLGSSNGLASGNTRSEAVLHALCELIERDQVSFWHAQKYLVADAPPTRLRLDSVSSPGCEWLLRLCRDAGLQVAAWYVTQDIPMPCFTCTVLDHRGETFYPQRASGHGCHPFRRIALSRAITEALQSRLTHIAGGRDDMFWALYRDVLPVDNRKGRRLARELAGEPQQIAFDDIPEAPVLATIDEMLGWAMATLRSAGFSQVIVVDLIQRRFGVPVVHVTVPGLEGPIGKPGYTPGPRMQQLLQRRRLS